MKSSVLYLEIVRYIHYIIFSDYYIRRATKRQMDFTRNRKMSFTDYIFAIIKGTKTSLQSSIYTFFESQKRNQMEYSKQAFSKGRQRIKPEAFQELFLAVAEQFYQKAETNSWRGYHLFGIDGTRLNLPCTQELKEIYGDQSSQGAPQVQALVSCLYDIKNKLEIENFTGYSPDAILQDFYATVFLANLAGVLAFELHEEIEAAHNKPENKYEYKMNRNRTISELKRTVIEMIATRSKIKRMRLFLEMKNRLYKAVVPVRPNRASPRVRKHKASKFSQNIKRP